MTFRDIEENDGSSGANDLAYLLQCERDLERCRRDLGLTPRVLQASDYDNVGRCEPSDAAW